MTTQTQAPALAPARLVLDGVPKVHFYEGGKRCPEDICFPSVLRAWLEYVHDNDYGCKHCMARTPDCKVNCTYSFLMGTSGVASFITWGQDWAQDNMAIHYMSDDPDAPYRRAFESVGFPFEWLMKDGPDTETRWRSRIQDSLREGRPVLGFGLIGPPEPVLIAGYDDGGDVMVGWSFFQGFPDFNAGVEFEPSGYFRKRNWFKDTECLAVLGAKQSQPDMGKVVREALRWMVEVTRTPAVYGSRPTGLAAYQAWADAVLRDEDLPAGDEAVLRQRHNVHNDTVGGMAEARWYGGQFLLQAVDFTHYSMAEELMRAAACYAGEHELMWKLWDLAGGNGNPDAWKLFAEPEVRRQIAQVILQSRDKYAEAAAHIEKALAK